MRPSKVHHCPPVGAQPDRGAIARPLSAEIGPGAASTVSCGVTSGRSTRHASVRTSLSQQHGGRLNGLLPYRLRHRRRYQRLWRPWRLWRRRAGQHLTETQLPCSPRSSGRRRRMRGRRRRRRRRHGCRHPGVGAPRRLARCGGFNRIDDNRHPAFVRRARSVQPRPLHIVLLVVVEDSHLQHSLLTRSEHGHPTRASCKSRPGGGRPSGHPAPASAHSTTSPPCPRFACPGDKPTCSEPRSRRRMDRGDR